MSEKPERTLLIVDDEPNILAALRRVFRSDRYQVLAASSGREGLELLALHSVGVILSDQRMPEMTGVEFLRRVKDLYPETVRIVLSGYTDLKSITDAINQGAIYKFLTKPWEDDQLRENIQEAFQRYELKQENLRLTEEIRQANHELSEINRMLEQRIQEKTLSLQQSMSVLQISQEILEYLPAAVIGLDETGLIVMANHAAHEKFVDETGEPLLGCMAEDRLPVPLPDYIVQETETDGFRPLVLHDGRSMRLMCRHLGDQCRSKGKVLVIAAEDKFNVKSDLKQER
jgi:response regulator RpfG family c-di-GMP phosphodiesterase